MGRTPLPSWDALLSRYRTASAKVLSSYLRKGSPARDLEAVERELGRGLPQPLRSLFESCAGSKRPFLFSEEGAAGPAWTLLAPDEGLSKRRATSEAEDWFPFASAVTGSMEWLLAMPLEVAAGPVLWLDVEAPEERQVRATTLDALFADELTRVERGEIVVVGFEAGRAPELLAKTQFEALGDCREAYLLPRAKKSKVERPAPIEEGLRFLRALVEQGWLRLGAKEAERLAPEIGKLLQRRASPEDRAAAILTGLTKEPGVQVAPIRQSRLAELISQW